MKTSIIILYLLTGMLFINEMAGWDYNLLESRLDGQLTRIESLEDRISTDENYTNKRLDDLEKNIPATYEEIMNYKKKMICIGKGGEYFKSSNACFKYGPYKECIESCFKEIYKFNY